MDSQWDSRQFTNIAKGKQTIYYLILNVDVPDMLHMHCIKIIFFMDVCRIVYCDETDEETSNVNVHQPTTFAHKNLQMEGISVFWDEFSDVSRAGCKTSPTPAVGVESLFFFLIV